LAEFKEALNYVALTYPNSEVGKSTELFITNKIPYLESLSFKTSCAFVSSISSSATFLRSLEISRLSISGKLLISKPFVLRS